MAPKPAIPGWCKKPTAPHPAHEMMDGLGLHECPGIRPERTAPPPMLPCKRLAGQRHNKHGYSLDGIWYLCPGFDPLANRGAPPSAPYLLDLRTRLREARHQAEQYSDTWNARMAELREYCDQNGYTELQRREKMNNDWDANDAHTAGTWWRNEATSLALTIVAEIGLDHYLGGAE